LEDVGEVGEAELFLVEELDIVSSCRSGVQYLINQAYLL
jgi:hypothetical protein